MRYEKEKLQIAELGRELLSTRNEDDAIALLRKIERIESLMIIGEADRLVHAHGISRGEAAAIAEESLRHDMRYIYAKGICL